MGTVDALYVMISGGVVPCGNCFNCVCELAVICASALSILADGCRNTLTTAIPLRDCDSMWLISSTTVVRFRSVIEMIRSAISLGAKPLKVQMMLTTGILMFGNMSVGVRTIASDPRIRIRIAITTMVCGCFNASLTIYIIPFLNILRRQARVRQNYSSMTHLVFYRSVLLTPHRLA